MSRRGDAGPVANVAKVVTLESTQRQVAVYNPSDPNEVRDPPIPNAVSYTHLTLPTT